MSDEHSYSYAALRAGAKALRDLGNEEQARLLDCITELPSNCENCETIPDEIDLALFG